MSRLILYCPKCGKELIKSQGNSYQCPDFHCNYILQDGNTIDISFKSKGIAKALSNLCNYPFTIDDVKCSSMEAFIQSLKVKDPTLQKDICSKTGPFCYSIREMFDDWRDLQIVYWKGKSIERESHEYSELLLEAYRKLYLYSPTFKYALLKAKPYTLTHSIGCTNKKETLLTPDEFIGYLKWLQDLII